MGSVFSAGRRSHRTSCIMLVRSTKGARVSCVADLGQGRHCDYGAITPMRLPWSSANQMFPSGPVVMPTGQESESGNGNSPSTFPDGDICRMTPSSDFVIHKFPSGPVVIPVGVLCVGCGSG